MESDIIARIDKELSDCEIAGWEDVPFPEGLLMECKEEIIAASLRWIPVEEELPEIDQTRLVEALGLRTKNTREVTLRMAVNEVVAVNTVEYVNAEQAGTLAAELKERQYRLVRWVSVEERLPADRVWVLVSWGTQGELVIAHWRADEQVVA
jgi:hypothetical protein